MFSRPSSPAAFKISEMTPKGPGALQDIIILNSDCSNEDEEGLQCLNEGLLFCDPQVHLG